MNSVPPSDWRCHSNRCARSWAITLVFVAGKVASDWDGQVIVWNLFTTSAVIIKRHQMRLPSVQRTKYCAGARREVDSSTCRGIAA